MTLASTPAPPIDSINRPFAGTVWPSLGIGYPETEGFCRQLGTGLDARVSGYFVIRHESERTANLSRGFDPFAYFHVARLNGRTVEIAIPEVGRFPAQLFSDGRFDNDNARKVEFHGWCRPVPDRKPEELAGALRTPVYDALLEAGHPELAELCRAAAVKLDGWPVRETWRNGERVE